MIIPLVSVTHGQCDARPTVTFPVYAGTKSILSGESGIGRSCKTDYNLTNYKIDASLHIQELFHAHKFIASKSVPTTTLSWTSQ